MKKRIVSFLVALFVLVCSTSAFANTDMKNKYFNQNFNKLVNQDTEYAFLLTDWNLAMYQPLSEKEYTANRIMDATYVDTFHLVYTTNPDVWDRLVELFGYYDYYEKVDNKRHRFPSVFAKPRKLSNGKTLYTMAFIKMSYYNCNSWASLRATIAQQMKAQDLFDRMSKQSSIVIDTNTYRKWCQTN